MNYPSEKILAEGVDRSPQRSLFKAMGYTDLELKNRPLVGIVNSWNTISPGHYNLRELGEFVKKGIYAGGGTAVEFGVIAPCDGIPDATEGMKYILPSREIICSSIEAQARTTMLDALVLLGSCDKVVPAMLMAAARLNLPAILVTGGPMPGGVEFDGRKSDQTSIDEALGMYQVGRVDAEKICQLEDLACPACGSCAFYGTANTMGCTAEALGLALPGSGLVPATYAQRRRVAFQSGYAVCELARRGIRARDIITPAAVRNAIRVVTSTSGSTNAVLHLSALVHEAELDMDVMEEFDRMYNETPQVARVNPAARWDMEDFYQAGGIPRVMERLRPLLDVSVMTCTGKTLGENLEEYRFQYPENREIIRTLEEPFAPKGGIAVLRGTLAPRTGVTKPGAFDPSLYRFQGRARVFDGEEAADQAILAGEIKPGDVLVIRYEGPRGGPGMREMYKAMKLLYGMGLGKSTAVVTDGRFSGTNNGCFVGHISPEAAEGGPIALVEDGDEIFIDVEAGRLDLLVSPEELERRRAGWKMPVRPEIPRGWLRLYAAAATSADRGAVMEL
ncbi:MAG: dihydroxy-acid dehydratase [Lawsonibacter sp.]|nr:dihydroxy-acid dehydratase [Lawsonibacter sp.]